MPLVLGNTNCLRGISPRFVRGADWGFGIVFKTERGDPWEPLLEDPWELPLGDPWDDDFDDFDDFDVDRAGGDDLLCKWGCN